jgi:hypothetical protein
MKVVFFLVLTAIVSSPCVQADCSCKDLLGPGPGGNCRGNYKFCYVNQPTSCSDASNSSLLHEQISHEACNGGEVADSCNGHEQCASGYCSGLWLSTSRLKNGRCRAEDSPDGYDGYKCEEYPHYCAKNGAWYNAFRTSCPFTCAIGGIANRFRLAGGRGSYEGRVEVRYGGQWGTICDDSWDFNDATVVCRSLGFIGAISAKMGDVSGTRFGQGNGHIWLDNLDCTGTLSNLNSCTHNGWGMHNCDHSEDAGVICSTGCRYMPCRF